MKGGDLTGFKHILAIGAHCDDLEIGCWGFIQRLMNSGAQVDCIILSSSEERKLEQMASFQEGRINGRIHIDGFIDGLFPSQIPEIKAAIQAFSAGQNYDLILSHTYSDRHQDHAALGNLAYNLFRDHLILEYEIPKYDVDTPQPNVFIPLTAEQIEGKTGHLARHFKSQSNKAWYSPETFKGLARLRGVQCNAAFAEAFICRKMVIQI